MSHNKNNSPIEYHLDRRSLLKRGAVISSGFLGILGPSGLAAFADTKPKKQSMREVNRRIRPLSCDTMVALPDATTTGTTVLGKNSDRPVFDCQPLVQFSRQKHARESSIKLEYQTIPQVRETYATIGSSPYWCWGYEEGISQPKAERSRTDHLRETHCRCDYRDAIAERIGGHIWKSGRGLPNPARGRAPT